MLTQPIHNAPSILRCILQKDLAARKEERQLAERQERYRAGNEARNVRAGIRLGPAVYTSADAEDFLLGPTLKSRALQVGPFILENCSACIHSYLYVHELLYI